MEKSKHDEVVEENKTLKTSVSDRDKQLETLKASAGDNEELKKQIDETSKRAFTALLFFAPATVSAFSMALSSFNCASSALCAFGIGSIYREQPRYRIIY